MTRNCRDESLQMSFQFFGMWRKSIPNWRWWITSPFWCVTFLFVTTTRSYFNRAFLIWLLGTPQKSSAGWNVSRPWPQRFESFWFERRHKYWKHLNLLSLLSANVLHTLRGGAERESDYWCTSISIATLLTRVRTTLINDAAVGLLLQRPPH